MIAASSRLAARVSAVRMFSMFFFVLFCCCLSHPAGTAAQRSPSSLPSCRCPRSAALPPGLASGSTFPRASVRIFSPRRPTDCCSPPPLLPPSPPLAPHAPGFITPDDKGSPDCFVHQSAVQMADNGFRFLKENERVRFCAYCLRALAPPPPSFPPPHPFSSPAPSLYA